MSHECPMNVPWMILGEAIRKFFGHGATLLGLLDLPAALWNASSISRTAGLGQSHVRLEASRNDHHSVVEVIGDLGNHMTIIACISDFKINDMKIKTHYLIKQL